MGIPKLGMKMKIGTTCLEGKLIREIKYAHSLRCEIPFASMYTREKCVTSSNRQTLSALHGCL